MNGYVAILNIPYLRLNEKCKLCFDRHGNVLYNVGRKGVKTMLEQNRFMELLQEIKEVATIQEYQITKEEIGTYFDGMDISEQQLEAVYQYLGDNGIKVPGFVHRKIEQVEEEKSTEIKGEKEENSVSHRFYMEELAQLQTLSQEEKTKFFLGVREGNEEHKMRLLEGYLPVVAELAEKYKEKGMPVDDLIQEGNIGLLQALGRVGEIAKLEDAETFLIESVRNAMVSAVDEVNGAEDWESAVVAKSGLIHEAAKYLAEDLGRVATVEELAEYTKLSVKEIEDIRNLSLDAIEVGMGE